MSNGIADRWADIDALLDELFEQPDELRRGWLDEHCEDAELRAMVLSLLAADSVHAAELEARAAAAHDWLSAHAAELPEIPGYRVIELIGEGGMASVFLAERRLGETVQRVALKRLRLNVYDPLERRRFEHEHRVLARLEHPNIAHLLDAGIAPDGVPWFAMEYVEGQPLVAWCDSRRLGIDARLALFADICTAVQHAHQHLVIHRDLKPSNIHIDNAGNVKLLDFGIARLLEPDTERPDGTRTELRRLTPGYAAPEQYAGLTTTATDIYALGMILVELLSGQKPSAHEASSDPLRSLTVTQEAADARASSRRVLERLLAGDVGAIARKAARSDPALRYGSAQALEDDLAALRTGRPVAARRGDWRYRAACFVRRHRTAVAAGMVITATLIVTTAISRQQAREARAQAERAQAAQDFIEDMLAPLRAGTPAARMPRLDEVLAQGVRDLNSRRQRDPVLYSDLMVMFADTYDRMGDATRARALAARAYAYSLAAFGANDPLTIRALALRGKTRLDSAAGIADVQAALVQMRRLGMGGVPMAEVLDALGTVQISTNHPKQASVLFIEAQRHRRDALGATHPDLALDYANLGYVESSLGHPSRALALFEKAYRHSVRYDGAETRRAAGFLAQLASAKASLVGWRRAEKDYDAALALLDRIDPNGSPERVSLQFEICVFSVVVDDMARAERSCNEVVSLAERVYGTGSRMHEAARRNRITYLVAQGRLPEAKVEGAHVRAGLQAIPGEVARISMGLFDVMYSDVQYIESDYAGMRDALLARRPDADTLWPGMSALLHARLALACDYAPAPECPAGLRESAEAKLAALDRKLAAASVTGQLALARLALHHADAADAHQRLDKIEATAAEPRASLPARHRWLAEARMLRGDAYAEQGDREAAVREWGAAETIFAARYTPQHPFRRQLRMRLETQVAGR